jgi:vacuolar-type H+-ATPase subunit H
MWVAGTLNVGRSFAQLSVGRPFALKELKISCDRADSRGVELGSDHMEVPEEENKVDLSLVLEKERNKILNQRTRDAKKDADRAEREATRATAKALKEATAAIEKKAKEVEKSRKSKALTPLLLLTETSITSPSENPRKQNASFAQLSMLRL